MGVYYTPTQPWISMELMISLNSRSIMAVSEVVTSLLIGGLLLMLYLYMCPSLAS